MLFISHSSKDLETVEALVDLFRFALAITPEEIRCTSLDPYGLSVGVSIDEQLRREVHEAKAFVGLISYSSLQSMYVVFELGARWGAGKHLLPLLAPGVKPGILDPPLSSLHSLSCGSAVQLHKLVRELASLLNVGLNPPSTYQRELDRILALAPAQGRIIIPEYLKSKLQLGYSARKDRLSGSQKEILGYLESESKKRRSVPQKDFETEFNSRMKSVYWRLETLCYLGFIEKEETGFKGKIPTFNYRLSKEYATWLSKQ